MAEEMRRLNKKFPVVGESLAFDEKTFSMSMHPKNSLGYSDDGIEILNKYIYIYIYIIVR